MIRNEGQADGGGALHIMIAQGLVVGAA